MNIDARKKTATMSVGEFARFSLVSSTSTSAPNALLRAQAGQAWHNKIQSELPLEPEAPQWSNERPIQGTISWLSWKIKLRGRIDQYAETSELISLREIKSTSKTLPIDPYEIQTQTPEHILQLLAYRELILRRPDYESQKINLELLYVNISTGKRQIHPITENVEHLLAQQLGKLQEYLEAKRERLLSLEHLKYKPAYETPRPGQETIQEDLQTALDQSPLTCLVAPTGYGKTGVAWEAALKKLANGDVDRILYLTSKTTGQIEATQRLQALISDDDAVSFWNVRNKKEHCINTEFRCSPQHCSYLQDLKAKWDAKGLGRLYLFSNDDITIEDIRNEGQRETICPYELMRAGIGFRDIWIGDYNYLFSPQATKLFTEQNDFDPKRTFLIIDEAHNLAERVKATYSLQIDAQRVQGIIAELQQISSTARIQNLTTQLYNEAANIERNQRLGPHNLELVFKTIDRLAKIISEEYIDYESLSAEANAFLWAVTSFSQYKKKLAIKLAAWAPADSVLNFSCLDASQAIKKTLAPYPYTLFLTATLPPFDTFCQSIGCPPQKEHLQLLKPPAPWRDNAYDVAIDLRIDTRMRERPQSTPILAKTIAKLIETHGPVAVFFPSYAYARSVQEAIALESPFNRIEIQTNYGSLQDRKDFIETGFLLNDALFLILGSSFSEGIDLLGGKLKMAVVVSPALPEVNPLRDAEMEQFPDNRNEAFERVYLQPGIQKVNQALGRLVRAPGQTVKVLLACSRFSEPRTQKLLDPTYQNGDWIMENEDLDTWLEK